MQKRKKMDSINPLAGYTPSPKPTVPPVTDNMTVEASRLPIAPEPTTSDVSNTIPEITPSAPPTRMGEMTPGVGALPKPDPNVVGAGALAANQGKPPAHSVFQSILEVLAGPQYTYHIDANTGQMVRVPVQRTKSQLANSIVAGALTGLFAGAGEHGPGSVERSIGKGGFASMQMHKQVDEEAQQQARDDFSRHAAVYETNLRTMLNQRQLSQMDANMHKQIIDSSRPLYEEMLKYPGAIIADNVPEHELLKYGATKANAIPVRFSEELDENGKPTGRIEDVYAVLDPNFKIKLPSSTLNYLADMGVKGFTTSDGKPINLPENQLVSIRTANNALQQANALQLFGNVMDSFKNVETNKQGPKFDNPDIESKIDKVANDNSIDPALLRALVQEESQGNPKAVSKKGAQGLTQLMPNTSKSMGVTNPFDIEQNLNGGAKYLKTLLTKYNGDTKMALAAYHGFGSDGNTTDSEYANQVLGLMKPGTTQENQVPNLKSLIKSDPTFAEAVRFYQKYLRSDVADTVKAMQEAEAKGDVPAGYTGKIVNALGGQTALQQYEQTQKANQLRMNAEAVAPVKEQEAQVKLDRENKIANQWGDKYLTEPDGFELNPDARYMNEKELKDYLTKSGVQLPPEFAGLFAVAHNKANLKTFAQKTYKGTEEASASKALGFIRQFINPEYDEKDFQASQKLKEELYSTRQNVGGGVIMSAGTASNHLEYLGQVAQALKNNDIQLLNKVKNAFNVQVGESIPVLMKAIADQVNQEVSKVISGGTPHQTELDKLHENLSTAQSPDQIRDVISGYVNLMQGRLTELNYRSEQLLGEPIKLSPQTAKVFGGLGLEVPGYGKPVFVNGNLTGFTQDGKTLAFKFQGQ